MLDLWIKLMEKTDVAQDLVCEKFSQSWDVESAVYVRMTVGPDII